VGAHNHSYLTEQYLDKYFKDVHDIKAQMFFRALLIASQLDKLYSKPH